MDNALYENRYPLTVERLSEFYRAFSRTWIAVIAAVWAVVAALNLIIPTFSGGEPNIGAAVKTTTIAAIFVVLILVRDKRAVKQFFDREEQADPELNRESVTKIGDDISVINESNGGVSSFGFERIKKLKQSKNLAILVTDDHQCIALDKGAFTVGSFDGFMAYIKEKCPRLKLK